MNRLSLDKREQILGLLVEGSSLRAITRLTGCSINTVTKLLVDLGKASAIYQDLTLRNLPCKYVEIDEVWSFCYGKSKNLPTELKKKPGYGDVWTWVSICPDTKLVPCWLVADRGITSANVFVKDLSRRMANRVQITSDGYHAYNVIIGSVYGEDVDYAQLVKMYGTTETDKRVQCIGSTRESRIGNPDKDKVTTSHIERQNLTMRMSMRRMTRKTNAHSKKIQNHAHAVALHFLFYNFGRIHGSLRVTPAMAAGVADHVWSLEEILELIE